MAPETRAKTGRRINFRMVLIALLLAGPFVWLTYSVVMLSVNSGIEQAGDYKSPNLKAMGNFAFDEYSGDEKQVPEVYRALDGQKVLLIGEMYSDMDASGQTNRFQLVYSIAKCCFGGPPKVQERVFANVPDGKKVPVYPRLAKVYGVLHVRAIRENGRVVSLYDLDVQRVEPYE